MSMAWMSKWLFIGCICLASTGFAQAPASAFRVETDIYFEDSKQPAKQTLTLFYEGVFYDFDRDQPNSITVIDPNGRRIVLLDRDRNVQTRISMDEILGMEAQVQQQLAESEMRRMVPTAEGTRFDSATMTMNVSAEALVYKAKCLRPEGEDFARQYADFADWSARLNAFYSDRPLPPFARLVLNRELAKQGLFPSEIQRVSTSRGRKSVVTSKLLANWAISKDDVTRVEKVGTMLVDFKMVDAKTFRQATETAQKPEAARR